MQKQCPVCGDTIIGRIDKKFCGDHCRNAHNNQLNKDSKNLVRNINNLLRKNYRILQELNPKGKTKTTKTKLIEKGFQPNFQLELTEFKSKKAYFITKTGKNKIIRLTNKKISLKDILIEHTENSLNKTDLSLIILTRAGKVYKILSEKIFAPNAKEIWIKHNDQIETKGINYKPNKIFVLSGAGNAKIIEVSPSKRETLADILFTDAGPFKITMFAFQKCICYEAEIHLSLIILILKMYQEYL